MLWRSYFVTIIINNITVHYDNSDQSHKSVFHLSTQTTAKTWTPERTQSFPVCILIFLSFTHQRPKCRTTEVWIIARRQVSSHYLVHLKMRRLRAWQRNTNPDLDDRKHNQTKTNLTRLDFSWRTLISCSHMHIRGAGQENIAVVAVRWDDRKDHFSKLYESYN